ncbi:MAG: DUF6231 family protein [Pseudomonadota bacterium]
MAPAHPFLPLIAETLRATGAESVVAVGSPPWPAAAVEPTRVSMSRLLDATAGKDRVALAVAQLQGDQDAREARQLIAVLRDLLARQLLVFVPETLLDDTALIGLGLTRQARYELDGEAWQAWSYDIRTYKSVPDWLNPRFWANPENWNRFRW